MALNRVRSEIPLILASLFIAAVIWLIARQADYESTQLQATVQLNDIPPFMAVEAMPPKVSIRVQHPKNKSNVIVEKNFVVAISVGQIFGEKPEQWGDAPTAKKVKVYKLSADSVVKNGLDPTVQVIWVDPQSIELGARLRTAPQKVVVTTKGTLPDNLMLVGTQPDPPELIFTGPSEALAKLEGTIKTEPIDLSSIHDSAQLMKPVTLPPDKDLTLLGHRIVTINIAVAENPVRQTIAKVPITLVTFTQTKAVVEPPTASVTLEGPASALKSIAPGDFEFAPDHPLDERPGKVSDVGLDVHLKTTVPAKIARQIKIVEVKPSRISVEIVATGGQNP